MGSFPKYLRLTWLMMKNCLIREMQFKANFLVRIFTEGLWILMQLVYIQVMYAQTRQIGGWGVWDMVVLLGTNNVITQLFEAFFYDNCMKLTDMIRQGDLDFNLIKPINSQFLVSLRYTDYASISTSAVGFAMIAYALHRMGTFPSVGECLLFLALDRKSVV